MAPTSRIVVSLKASSEELKKFDFSGNKAPILKKARKRPTKKSESEETNDEDSKPVPTTVQPPTTVDPVLGSLPRSLKAAPVANTSGLSLDKTPSRKWRQQTINLKTISGYTIGVKAWASDFTEQEWLVKLKQDAEEEQSTAATPELADTPEPTKAPTIKTKKIARKPVPKLKLKVKEEPPTNPPNNSSTNLPTNPSAQHSTEASVMPAESVADEDSSDPPSEAPSEPMSEAPSEI